MDKLKVGELNPRPCPVCKGEFIINQRYGGYDHPAIDCTLSSFTLESEDDIIAWNNRPIEDALTTQLAAAKDKIARLEGKIQGMLEKIEATK